MGGEWAVGRAVATGAAAAAVAADFVPFFNTFVKWKFLVSLTEAAAAAFVIVVVVVAAAVVKPLTTIYNNLRQICIDRTV